MDIKQRVFPRGSLYSPGNGRDYLMTPEGEIFSINGLYCDKDGNQDRWGSYAQIMDIRWTVVVWRDCVVGTHADCSYRTERRLQFTGDNKDQEILAHYGYRVERDAEGYQNIVEEK